MPSWLFTEKRAGNEKANRNTDKGRCYADGWGYGRATGDLSEGGAGEVAAMAGTGITGGASGSGRAKWG